MSYTATPSRLSVLMRTDIVGSTELKARLGLSEYARRLARHDRIFKQLIDDAPHAEILKDTGDGYFASFATTSDAVRAALRFQQAMHEHAQDDGAGEPLKVRIGIHVGEVAEMEEEQTGKPKIVGLAADLVSRVTQLADGNQILLTRFAFNEARQFVSAFPHASNDNGEIDLKWIAHGPYRFKGAEEAIEVYEVGVAGIAPLRAPTDRGEARRAVATGEDETLGWRPAVGLEVPDRPHWELEKRLGEGGFGEVWLARHVKLGTHRAFKFCFDADRLRSLKRELTLFRILLDSLGERADIARLYEVKLDEPPYFLESEYTEGGNLQDWSDMEGGIAQVPPATRLDIVARVADAVAAAHSVGVLHKDIKPSNILIAPQGAQPRPQLADFGIGIVDRSRVGPSTAQPAPGRPITMTAVTMTGDDDASRTGTRIYLPPEVLVGRPFTVQGDVYALGVLLYQMVVGDLTRPLAEGWERDVTDELLREDIAACVDGDPARRLSSAADLAKRLRSLPHRRQWKAREADETRAAARRRRLGKVAVGAAISLVVVLCVVGFVAWREWSARRQAERLSAAAEEARKAEADQRQIADEVGSFLISMMLSVRPDTNQGRDVKMIDALDVAARKLEEKQHHPEVEAYLRHTLAQSYHALGEPKLAEPQARRAVELITKRKGPDHRDTHGFSGDLGMVLLELGRREEAEKLLRQAVENLARILGPEDDTTISYMINHALALLEMERETEAEPIINRIAEVKTKRHGPDSEEALEALNMKGGLYYQRGRYAEALDVFGRVYESRRRVHGDDHSLTLLSGHNYASLLFRLGRVDEAVEAMSRVLESQKRVMGPEHPRTLDAMLNLSQMVRAQQNYPRALELLRELHAIRSRKLGPEHPDTLRAAGMLGSTMASAGDPAGAEPLLRQTVELQRKVLGPDNTDIMNIEVGLAESLERQEKFDEAVSVYRHALAEVTRLRGVNHVLNTLPLVNFGRCLRKMKRFEEAEQVLLRGLKLSEDPTAPSAKGAANFADQLTVLYEAWAKPDKAAEFRARADALRATTHPATATATAPATRQAQ